jgi:hypothetical protein
VTAVAWSPDGSFALGADEPDPPRNGAPAPAGPRRGIHLWPGDELKAQ